MKTKMNINLLLTALILIMFAFKVSAQFNFIDVAGEPVLSYGSSGQWDDAVVWIPKVIKDGDTLRMWYTGHNESIWTASTVGKIGYAWSLDGFIWNKLSENPVLEAEYEWEGGKLFGCAVIKDAELYKMWYGAEFWRSTSSYVVSPAKKIGYAESSDGINWIKHPEPLLGLGPASDWDDNFIVPYTVIKEGNEYKMWYYAGRYGFPMEGAFPQIGLATSPDGIQWTKYDDPETPGAPYSNSDPVMVLGESGHWDSERTFEPMVMKTDTGYFMFYTGLKAPITNTQKQQIGFAYSTDGIHWNRDENNPIIKDDNSLVEWGYGIYNGTALYYDNEFHFWFGCFHTPPNEARPQIGYAISNPVGIDDNQQSIQFQLCRNWPNPFATSTTIEYELTKPSSVQYTIYDYVGNKVEVIEQKQSYGKQQISWNAKGLPAGIYFCILKTNEQTFTSKLIKL